MVNKHHIFSLLLFVIAACSKPGEVPVAVPQQIGDRELTEVKYGADARQEIDEMHGLRVSSGVDAIARYGNGSKADILYITSFKSETESNSRFTEMIEKMAQAKGPFYHLMPLPDYEQVYIAFGMGALHYIYPSGTFLIWYTTYQEAGKMIPEQLNEFYPAVRTRQLI
jgi:hypothetical protein